MERQNSVSVCSHTFFVRSGSLEERLEEIEEAIADQIVGLAAISIFQ